MSHSNPLQWPFGRPRTKYPRRSNFIATLNQAENGVYYQLKMLGASSIIITSNMVIGRNGQALARQTAEDTGIAVYFDYESSRHCIAIDRYHYFWENMRAIEKSLEAIRGLERWGGAEIVKTSLGGFKELPDKVIITPNTSRVWWEVLQVSPNADWEIIEAAYKKMLFKSHPDQGGSDYAFQEVQNAYKQAKEARG